jgi:lipopolysaccharide export LptBFGC system permease protein LptF
VWQLSEARRVELAGGRVREVEAPRRAALLDSREAPAEIDPMHRSTRELSREIAALEADGYDATRLRVDLQWKRSRPLACLALPLAALLLAVAGPPFLGPAAMLLAGLALAAAYLILVGVATSLGYAGALPPGWAAFSPAGLVALAALALARSRELTNRERAARLGGSKRGGHTEAP